MDTPEIHALLVDDDPVMRDLLSAILVDRGYAVDCAADGQDALGLLEGSDHNLVVTDHYMPVMDGLSLCRALRQRLRGRPYVYCIMLTAADDEATLVAAMEAGVDDFLGKPLREAELGARLHAAERVLALEAGLANRNRELGEAYARVRRELEMARALQRGLLPAPAQFAGARFDWLFQASSYVGGDTFDYFQVGPTQLCFHVVDVAGHGVAAAMMAFNAQHQLRALSQQVARTLLAQGRSLSETAVHVVSDYNQRVLQSSRDPSHYLTLLYGLADLRAGQAALVQAGHPPALLAAAGSEDFRPVGEGGLPLGIVDDGGFEARDIALSPGARLALYSDGVTECRNRAGQAFGTERLRTLLAQQRRTPLAGTARALDRALAGWHDTGLDDDITFLTLEAA